MVTFDSVRPIFEYSRTWDFKAYKAQQHSVTTLREQMQRIGVWVNELEKMRARQPCGILEVSEVFVVGRVCNSVGNNEKDEPWLTFPRGLLRSW